METLKNRKFENNTPSVWGKWNQEELRVKMLHSNIGHSKKCKLSEHI